jgi:hypothetical protein
LSDKDIDGNNVKADELNVEGWTQEETEVP